MSASEAVAHHVVRVVSVFLDVVPQAATDRAASRIEQVRPRIGSARNGVRHHDSGERAEGHPVTGKAGCGVLMIGHFPDVRETVWRLDDLP